MIMRLSMEALIIIYNNPFGPGLYLHRNPKSSVAQTIKVLGYFSFLPIKMLSSCDSATSTTSSTFTTQEDKKTENCNKAVIFHCLSLDVSQGTSADISLARSSLWSSLLDAKVVECWLLAAQKRWLGESVTPKTKKYKKVICPLGNLRVSLK